MGTPMVFYCRWAVLAISALEALVGASPHEGHRPADEERDYSQMRRNLIVCAVAVLAADCLFPPRPSPWIRCQSEMIVASSNGRKHERMTS
jgi:hypothetical protein